MSNYETSHLNEIMAYATVQPMVNQIEVHPRFPNVEVRQFCKDHGAASLSFAPDMRVRCDGGRYPGCGVFELRNG